MDGLYHQNQNGRRLDQPLESQEAIIQVNMDLATSTGLLRSTIRAALITRASSAAISTAAL